MFAPLALYVPSLLLSSDRVFIYGEDGMRDNHSVIVIFLFQKIDSRKASDKDLKLSDLLRYHMRDSEAAKDLLYRRLRCLHNLDNANKNLDKARAKGKNIAEVSLKN